MGKKGEEWARKYLRRQGWSFVAQNVRFPQGELDLVFLDSQKELVFVEVRTRTKGWLQPPESTLGPQKIRRLLYAARQYVAQHEWEGYWRIDLVALKVFPSGAWEVEHFEDITAGGVLF